MNKEKALIGLVVAAVAAIPVAWQWGKIRSLESELAGRAPAAAAPEVDALRATVAELTSQLEKAQRPVGKPVTALATGEDRTPEPSAMSGIANMFEDPAMREVVKQQMKGQMGFMYGDFIEHLGLEGEEKAAFEELLVERQMLMAAKGMKLMSGQLRDGEKVAIREELQLAKSEMDEKLKESLGEESYAEFQSYEESAGERMELNAYKDALQRDDAAELTLEQEEKLMAMMFEERKAFNFSGGFNPDNTQIPDWEPSEESVGAIAAEYQTLHEQIAARAGEVLDDGQVAVFLKNQESHRKMMEAGLKMSVQLFRGQDGAKE